MKRGTGKGPLVVYAHFDVGSEVLVFGDDAELVEHARRALRDRAWADSVRRAGRARTLAHHTLVHRMREVERAWR